MIGDEGTHRGSASAGAVEAGGTEGDGGALRNRGADPHRPRTAT